MSLLWKKCEAMKEEPKICKVERYDGSPCGRPLYDDKHCIFHSKDIERKKEEFSKAFWEEFKRQEEEEEVFDFTGFIFPDDISFVEKEFNMPLLFRGATFSNSADFRLATFSDKASFVEATFSNLADFRLAIFSDKINFTRATFSDLADFTGATFSDKAYFREATFSNSADFRLATFSDKASFVEATFSNSADFTGATFSDKAYFVEATFSNSADFKLATFSNSADFFIKEFSKIILTNTYFEDVEGLFESLKEEKKILKIFKTIKYKIDDFTFILGQKAEAKYPIIAKKAKDAYFLADFKNQHPIIHWLWNITSKCGQSLARWALVSLLIALLFGAIYADYSCPSWLKWMNWENWMEKVNPIMAIDQTKAQGLGIIRKATWFTPYYFSIVTFTTLGFGDVTPVNLAGEIWLAIEVILGYIMLGGLISIFANKLARRS